MTKKPSEKNKAWEKDRRDRLNKTFDELAKLLPKYDASVVWSKIEIIQKAITFITDLQQKQQDYLKTNDPVLLKEYEEFVSCLKFYQERNAQLTELLKKAKVTLPPLVLPQLLVDKPELVPKADKVEAVSVQKPKRVRNRSKKNANTDESEEKREDQKAAPDKDRSSPLRPTVDIVTKPTAIITAFSRENPAEAPVIVQPPPPQPSNHVPVKPLLLRLRKPYVHRRLKLIPKPMLRKCYPHPDRILRLSKDAVSHRKLPPKQRRAMRMKQLRADNPLKRLKLETLPEPIREQSVSPTAAFLLSFPVVTSSMLSGKNVENTENSVGLENLNNFFTTEEYSKFCDQNTVAEDKVPTLLPVENGTKSSISGKPMTSFTVSAITRPSSPKKPIGHCEQVNNKRLSEAPWIVESKLIRTTPATSFESCYNFTNVNPMIGSTSMCRTSMRSTSQQVTSAQYSPINTQSTACLSSPATELKTPTKLVLPNAVPAPSKPNSTGKFFPRYINSMSSNSSTSVTAKPAKESSPKSANIAQSSLTIQKGNVDSDIIPATSWTVKSVTSSGAAVAAQGPSSAYISKPGGCKSSSKVLANTTTTMSTATNPSISSFYSPTKTFFYDVSPQSQPITTLNLSLPPTTSLSSSADPLISSTAVKKSHSFLGFPSIKTEFPWVPPNTTSFTMPLTTTPTTTTSATCNLSTNYTPFDLASIVSESLTSTSFAFSLTTPKSSEPTVVEAGHKQNSANKCNQMNLFLPYEDAQYTPTFTFSLTKPTDSQAYPTAREVSWKSEKTKDISDQIFYDCEQSKPQQKSHVNWMTTPATDYTPAPAAPPLPPIDFGNQFPSSTNFDFGFGCRKDSYDDDNQFNWSPTKPLTTDFSTAYSFENFGSSEPPPNKTVKQIFSVSQLVDPTPSPETSSMKKTVSKTSAQKSTPIKQTFSNIYSAESLIAKKDNNRMTNATNFYNPDASNAQSDYHSPSNYFYNYPNTQSCLQAENDYLGASTYSASSNIKTTSILPTTGGTVAAPTIPPFDATTASSTTNYFVHSISSNNNDPYDPTYFPSSNYNHPTTANWSHTNTKAPSVNGYNQSQLPLAVAYGTVEPPCQQNANVTGNLTNFNLSSICPEIDGKDSPSGW